MTDPTKGIVARMVQQHRADSRARLREPFSTSDRSGMPAREDLGKAERRAFLGIAPRKSLWPELEKLDKRTGALGTRQGEVQDRIRALTEQRADAPRADAAALAQWELGDRRGAKPEPTADALDQRIADAERERDGLEAAVDVAQEEKASYVEAHRERLVSVAEQQTTAAHARMLELIDELEQTRTTLLEVRAASMWASLFPDPAAATEPPTSLVAAGLAKPIADTLGLQPAPQIQAARLLELLRRDADTLKGAATPEQRAALNGHADQRPASDAVWADTPAGEAQRKRDHDAAIERYTREWGHAPAW